MPEVVIEVTTIEGAELVRDHIVESGIKADGVEIRRDSEVPADAA